MKNISQQITQCSPAEPSAGLFDRIICAIATEKEFRQTRKLLAMFTLLLVVSVIALPFSASLFAGQWRASGTPYFIGTAMENTGMFFDLWQDFTLSILESLPVMPIILLMLNIALLLFSIKLFLHKKGILFKFLKHSIPFN